MAVADQLRNRLVPIEVSVVAVGYRSGGEYTCPLVIRSPYGGGIRGGKVIGQTDEFGFKAVADKVSVQDLHGTILGLLGIDHEKLTFRYSGRDFRLTDVGGNVIQKLLG